MGNTVVPIVGHRRRLPQVGRIRTGVKTNTRMGRKSINTFRFTSPDRKYLEPVAAKYGGEIHAFADDKSGDRFEVITDTAEVAVILPPDPMSECYEMWSGERGLERRCDGEECDILQQTPDGADFASVPCVCEVEGVFKCQYKLRVNFLVPEVQTIGTWRLDTRSQHAREEIPGVVELIEMAQGRGLYHATLRLEQRVAPGKRFNVPVLDPGVSVDALSAGAARLASLPGSPPASLPAAEEGSEEVEVEDAPNASASPSAEGLDDYPMGGPDDIIDAEVVEEVDPTIAAAFIESLSAKQKAGALKLARSIATSMDLPLPTNAASITPEVLNLVIEEFQRDDD